MQHQESSPVEERSLNGHIREGRVVHVLDIDHRPEIYHRPQQ
jgi:hypothetical protein